LFGPEALYQGFVPRLYTKVLFRGFIPRFCSEALYQGFVPRLYTITGLPTYTKLYVHKNLITKGDIESVTGTINLEEANTLLGCHKIDTQDKGTVTMSKNALCSVMGGRKSRKQRRSKRRRRRGRQSRK